MDNSSMKAHLIPSSSFVRLVDFKKDACLDDDDDDYGKRFSLEICI